MRLYWHCMFRIQFQIMRNIIHLCDFVHSSDSQQISVDRSTNCRFTQNRYFPTINTIRDKDQRKKIRCDFIETTCSLKIWLDSIGIYFRNGKPFKDIDKTWEVSNQFSSCLAKFTHTRTDTTYVALNWFVK